MSPQNKSQAFEMPPGVVGLRNDEHQRHKIESTSRASISMIRDQVNITSKAASTSQLQVFLLAGNRCSARKSLHI